MTSRANPLDDADAVPQRAADAQGRAAPLGQWLDALIDTSPMAMGIISTFDNRYVRANAALAEIYGMPVEEILSSDPFSMAMKITHPDELVAEQKLFAELVAGTRRAYQIEKRCVRPDGSFRWGFLTFAGIFEPSPDPAVPAGVLHSAVVQIVDITERKALADALARREEELRHAQKLDGIGRLAAGVAHDFNNLLTVITGHAEILARLARDRAQSTPRMDESLEAILEAAERATGLTTQLLAYGRRGAVKPQTLVLSSAVARLQRWLGRALGSSVAIDQALSATGSILADEGHLTQVVLNLVLNARDALPEGGSIKVATRDLLIGENATSAMPPVGDWVSLVVSDTGHGMSPEVQARMFEPFFTTRSDRAGTHGTGLGLATVQRIVAESGGHIDVKSAPGQGTAVTVFFPRVASAPKASEPARSRARPVPAPNSRRILVVEDEPSVRALIGTVLLGAHYWVMVARDGQEALSFIEAEREPFDLIVTDMVMPGLGGLSLAQRLHEKGISARMLFVSGYSDHALAELLPYGSLLSKPFTPTQLLGAVEHALADST